MPHTGILPSIDKVKFMMSQGKLDALPAPSKIQTLLEVKEDTRKLPMYVAVFNFPPNASQVEVGPVAEWLKK
jgi:hypothetical protein